MALTKTLVSGTITLPDDSVIGGSAVQFTLTSWDTDTQVVAPQPVQATLGATGDFTVALWPNDRGLRGTQYVVHLLTSSGGLPVVQSLGTLVVPNTPTATFHTLLDVTPAQLPTTNVQAAQSAALAQAYADAIAPYTSLALAQSADVPGAINRISVIEGRHVFDYLRDPAGTDLTTNDGANWRLSGKDKNSSQSFWEMDETFIQRYGGLSIQDNVNNTQKRAIQRIDRSWDITLGPFTDPQIGTFTQPHSIEITNTITGEYGTDNSGAMGARMIATNLNNRSNQPATAMNITYIGGGVSPKATWAAVFEGYDKSAGMGEVEGDPDYDAFYGITPAAGINGAGNIMIASELNMKLKLTTVGVGQQVLLNTYGNLVLRNGGIRPTARDGVIVAPGSDGGDVVGSSYINLKTAANIKYAFRSRSSAFDESTTYGPKAQTQYAFRAEGDFLVAAVSMDLGNRMVFDTDAGTPNQLQMGAVAAGVLAISGDAGATNVVEFRPARMTVRTSIHLETSGTVAQSRDLLFLTNTEPRWRIRADNQPETGSDTGSDLRLSLFLDNGTEVQVMTGDRATQTLDFKTKVVMSALPTSPAGLAAGGLWIDTTDNRTVKAA